MNKKALDVLEYHKIIELLKCEAGSTPLQYLWQKGY